MANTRGDLFVYHAAAVAGPAFTEGSGHPLWRRLTWSSKAILAAVACWERQYEVALAEIAATNRIAIYYGTLFGEMEAGLTVTAGILKSDHVISPTAFQQSVHNAPVGYLTQILRTNAPTATIASGLGSFDRALAMASEDILASSIDLAIVINAAEHHIAASAVGVKSEAEICVLSAGERLGFKPNWRLESINWEESSEVDKPGAELHITPLSLDTRKDSFIRDINVGHGRSIISSWHRVNPTVAEIAGGDLLPHRGAMLLIDRLTEIKQDGSALVEATLQGDTFLFNNGKIRPHGLVEVLAQASGAAFNAGRKLSNPDRKPAFGYLLSIDEFDATGAYACKPGDTLKVQVTLEADIFPVGKHRATAFLGTTVVAGGVMKFLSDENSEMSNITAGRAP